MRRGWSRVVICASGPSFLQSDAVLIRDAQPKWRVICINTMFKSVPFADVLYAGDKPWWDMYTDEVRWLFWGECWTLDRGCAHRYGLQHVEYDCAGEGLCTEPGRIHCGSDSGHACLNLAYHFGAREILLTGFDYQDTDGRSHSHGDHPEGLGQERPHDKWLAHLPAMVNDLRRHGVKVINCSRKTAIPESVVPRGELAECL